jgi:hypothetical protein
MMTMDSAARAIDMMLHRGRAEERDGGVWLDDLAVSYVAGLAGEVTEAEWKANDATVDKETAEREVYRLENLAYKYDTIVRAVITCFDAEADDADALAAIGDVIEQCRCWPTVALP